jgi:capsular polysaccharide biosynthesis protein
VKNADQPVNNLDQTALLSLRARDGLPQQTWAVDDWQYKSAELSDHFAASYPAGMASLAFIRTALRRTRKFWLLMTAVGLVLGAGLYKERPAAYEASTSLLVGNTPDTANGVAVANDQALVQSRTVAAEALKRLGLKQNPASFVGQYTSTIVTNQLLQITVKASSYDEAVREANALTAAFLAFQANLLQKQEQQVDAAMQQKVSLAEQHLSSVEAQISQLSAQGASSTQQTQLAHLRTERDQAANQLTVLKQTTAQNEASTELATETAIKGTQVLDAAAPVPQSSKKRLLLYGGGGLVGGLAIGMGTVVIGALVSDKLRRRDDIARALGAPIRLSVGAVSLRNTGPWRNAAARSPEVGRIVTHLDSALSPGSAGPATLAVVPADDVTVPAACLASFALSHAERGERVVVADLHAGAPAARLLGSTSPGLELVSLENCQLVVMIPDGEDILPPGPLRAGARRTPVREKLARACASADLLLTLAELDPSLGSAHLADWTRSVVVTVTAGLSTAERIDAVGELVRLSGVRFFSGLLIGADKSDESLGVTESQEADGADAVPYRDSASDPAGAFVRASGASRSGDTGHG